MVGRLTHKNPTVFPLNTTPAQTLPRGRVRQGGGRRKPGPLTWSAASGPGAARSTATTSSTACSYLLTLSALSPATTITAVQCAPVSADATRSVGRRTQGSACSTRPVPVVTASCCARAVTPPLVGRRQARRQEPCSAVMALCRVALVRSPCSLRTAAPFRSGTTCRICLQLRAHTSRLSGRRLPSGASSCAR